MLTDTNLGKVQLSKTIQFSRFLWIKIDKFQRYKSGRRVLRVRKGFTLFFWNEDMNDIRIMKSLENLGL